MVPKILILKVLILRLGTERLRLKKSKSIFAAECFDMTVFVAYMNFGADSAIDVVDNSFEVLRTLESYRGSGFEKSRGYYLLMNLSFDHGFAKKSLAGAVVFDFSENR